MDSQIAGGVQRSLLSLAIVGCFSYYSSSGNAQLVIHESNTITDYIQAGSQDDAALVVGSNTLGAFGGNTLLLTGTLENPNGSGAGLLIQRITPYKNENSFSFDINSGLILADGGADGIVFRAFDTANVLNIGASFIRRSSIIESTQGKGIYFETPVTGSLWIGEGAKVIGDVGIEADSTGYFYGEINNSGIIRGRGDAAIDFSKSALGINLILSGNGIIDGEIKGSTNADDDLIKVWGGKLTGDISNVENITFGNSEWALFSDAAMVGNITGASNMPQVKIADNMRLVIGNGGAYQWRGNVKLYGRAIFSVDPDTHSGSSSEAVIQSFSGNDLNFQFMEGSEIGLNLADPEDYDLLSSTTATTFDLVKIDDGAFSDEENNPLTDTDDLIFYSVLFDGDFRFSSNKTLSVDITTRNLETVGDMLGEDDEKVIEPLMQTIADNVGMSAADNAFQILATVSSEDGLKTVAEQNRPNNSDSIVQASTEIGSAFTKQLTHRLGRHKKASLQAAGDEIHNPGFWIQGLHVNGKQKERHNSDGTRFFGYDLSIDGVALGFDRTQDEWTLGIAGGWGTAAVDLESDADHEAIDHYQLGVYGQWNKDRWYAQLTFNTGIHAVNKTRYVDNFVSAPLESDFDRYYVSSQFMGGKHYDMGTVRTVRVQPMAGLNYSLVRQESYREKDTGSTGFAQKVNAETFQRMEAGLGVSLSSDWMLDNGVLTPSLGLMGWYDLRGKKTELTAQSVLGGSEFTVKGADPVRERWVADAKLTYAKGDNMEFSVGYERRQQSGFHSDNYRMSLRYHF
ncbi:Outer membrane protein B [invertebrate metagenome]|uniref:Outer membrane protein B n=1 Tax=invertebrate metagenome TaxID=1711999 RepID=A0A2H9T5G7_9ZZZZ